MHLSLVIPTFSLPLESLVLLPVESLPVIWCCSPAPTSEAAFGLVCPLFLRETKFLCLSLFDMPFKDSCQIRLNPRGLWALAMERMPSAKPARWVVCTPEKARPGEGSSLCGRAHGLARWGISQLALQRPPFGSAHCSDREAGCASCVRPYKHSVFPSSLDAYCAV